MVQEKISHGDNWVPKIVIDSNKCKQCEICVEVCPKKLIKKGSEVNSQGYFYMVFDETGGCTGCSLCAQNCPDMAIKEVYR